MLYEDYNRVVPDFWWRTVTLRELVVCDHGIHFMFNEDQDERPHYVALVIVRPTWELYNTRVRQFQKGPSELWMRNAENTYVRMLNELTYVGVQLESGHVRIDFSREPEEHCPKISPWNNLRVIWGGVEVELRGYVDVYMTMVS